ncbi:unnamed protein product, partial [marine sediment metagenome]
QTMPDYRRKKENENMKQKHICEVKNKTARILAGTYLNKDSEHKAILKGARVLVDAGFGDYEYLSQSTKTVWTNKKNGDVVSIWPNGSLVSKK